MQGLELNDLVDKCKFTKDQRTDVLKAIHIIEPHFKPVYSVPIRDYNCSLVDHLNPDVVFKDPSRNFTSPAQGLIDTNELMNKVYKQIECEVLGSVAIENIENKGNVSETVIYCVSKKLYNS